MKNMSFSHDLVLSGLFITSGLVLPVAFHLFGLGSAFLPMHIPVILAGFVLPASFALIIGAATPLLSSIITGMPPLFPVLPYMFFELVVYGTVASILSRKLKWNVYVTLVCSMAAGRTAAGVVVWLMVTLFGVKLPTPLVFIVSSLVTGIPGIIIQLAIIPPMVVLLKKMNVIRSEVART